MGAMCIPIKIIYLIFGDEDSSIVLDKIFLSTQVYELPHLVTNVPYNKNRCHSKKNMG